MNPKQAELKALVAQAEQIYHSAVMVETNAGTFGPAEVRAAGVSGDNAVREVSVIVGTGVRLASGPRESRAPGRLRTSYAALDAARRELCDLLDRIRPLSPSAAKRLAIKRQQPGREYDDLPRGRNGEVEYGRG